MAIETSVYLLKPEGMTRLPEIRQMIENVGLRILRVSMGRMTREILTRLYPDLSPELLEQIYNHLGGQLYEAGLVDGENAIARLVEICGKSTDPARCGKETIRALFGFSISRSGFMYHFNVIHRSQGVAEAGRDRRLFGLF